ncbi:cupin domain-containing protein [Aliiglaciecola sp. LCG003]|uniref:cupin domain-containing protein n=1 Tax=Aliiglaciecola sp. LCG003 TaxID=3053655 RepID=UPI002572E341|nr:cupin domain-containing protein [Aliiglaciecola sp. LCG003]WJG11222.1 cupin domain-containing protein [Aliiglaciecola sp. LCG003]
MSDIRKLRLEQLVQALDLEGHIEGGYFRQTYRSKRTEKIHTCVGERVTATSIYYLLTSDSHIGHFHKNLSDIVHYFHLGDPITYYLIYPDGHLETKVLGSDVLAGQQLQLVVEGGVWKASAVSSDGAYGYGLIGEAVAPGFEYTDMQLGETATLTAAFPEHCQLIEAFCRKN